MSKVILKNTENVLVVKCIDGTTIDLTDGDLPGKQCTALKIVGFVASCSGNGTVARNGVDIIKYNGNVNWTPMTTGGFSLDEEKDQSLTITQGTNCTAILWLAKEYVNV